MYNKYFFRDNHSIIHPFRTRSKFTPPPPDNSNLTEYISQIYHDLKTQHTQQKQHKPNITSTDLHSINQLKNNNDIIIKPADKGGAIVIWPKKDYLTEAYRQLNNTNHYQRISDDPTPQIQQQIKTLVKKMHDDQLIDDTTNKFLSPENTTNTIPTTQNTQTWHTRKTNHIRLWMLYSETLTVRRLDPKTLLQIIPSYIQDTTDVLKRIFALNDNLPTGIIRITIYVKSLYTNIRNDEGIKACIDMLKENNPSDKQNT